MTTSVRDSIMWPFISPGYPDRTLTADTKMGPISQSQMSLTFRKYDEWSFNILNVNILRIAFLSAWDSFSTILAMIFDDNSYISVYFKRDSFLYHFFYPWYLCDFSFCDKCDTDTEWKIIANLAKCSFAKNGCAEKIIQDHSWRAMRETKSR